MTSITQSDIGDRYFVFVADGQDLMLHSALATNSSQKKNDATTVLYYENSVEPFRDLTAVFTLEPNGANMAMRNLYYNTYQLQTSSNRRAVRGRQCRCPLWRSRSEWVYESGCQYPQRCGMG